MEKTKIIKCGKCIREMSVPYYYTDGSLCFDCWAKEQKKEMSY